MGDSLDSPVQDRDTAPFLTPLCFSRCQCKGPTLRWSFRWGRLLKNFANQYYVVKTSVIIANVGWGYRIHEHHLIAMQLGMGMHASACTSLCAKTPCRARRIGIRLKPAPIPLQRDRHPRGCALQCLLITTVSSLF